MRGSQVLLERLHIGNFTVFEQATFEFCPGINVLIGTNGTGKTHLLKLAYAAAAGRTSRDAILRLVDLFQPTGGNRMHLVRHGQDRAILNAVFDRMETKWLVTVLIPDARDDTEKPSVETRYFHSGASDEGRTVFVPSKELLAHGAGIRSFMEVYQSSFDLTFKDILDLAYLPPLKDAPKGTFHECMRDIQQAIGGKTRVEGEEFRLQQGWRELEFSLVAEGHRKLALLWKLIENGSVRPGTLLLWDEPEANLNPELISVLIDVLWRLSRAGVQVVLATHSYFVLREIDLGAQTSDRVRYFSLSRTKAKSPVTVEVRDSYEQIIENPIARKSVELYQRSLDRALRPKGGNDSDDHGRPADVPLRRRRASRKAR
ncbi:MAG: hypothetical protein FJX68_13830 [Alphaproteobacteria bacterium]|nr:hypothetical protein [Alphaproteobacteria bacterium]